MRYTLKQLRYLEAAARLKSITSAADELNISPSSIAAAIDKLEDELGKPLFSRHPSKGIVQTKFGAELTDKIRLVLNTHKEFENAIQGVNQTVEGSIRIGCFTPVAPIVLPVVLKQVSEHYPTLSIQIIEGDATRMIELMNADEIDLALTYNVSLPGFRAVDRYEFSGFFHAPPHVTLSSDHPFSNRSSLSLQELADEPLILLNLDRTRTYMLGLFEKLGITPNVLYSSMSSEMVRSLVAAGFGYAIFNVKPSNKQTYPVGDIVRIPLSSSHLEPEFGMLHRGHQRQPNVVNAVLEACDLMRDQGTFRDFVVDPVVGS